MKSLLLKYIIITSLIIFAGNCRRETPVEYKNLTTDDTEQVIYIASPLFGAVYKPGDTLNIVWESSLTINTVNVKIFKKEELRGIIADQISNEQHYEWAIPLNFLPSTQYKIKVESVNNPDVYNFSSVFSILLQ